MDIAFLDTEIDPTTHKVLDIGCILEDGRRFHANSITAFTDFMKGAAFVCGHNILKHDLKYIHASVSAAGIPLSNALDTLYWSPLLFPQKPYHALVKDDKLQTEAINNPLNDSMQARDLFHAEVASFQQLPSYLKQLYWLLLREKPEFSAFFQYLGYKCRRKTFTLRRIFNPNSI
ncbi:MAG: hypothetical protein Q7T20_18825 [Saprospiraceae bacterium]|nr:hypothetical protein [Saprospiraceae bacterium]